MLTSNMTEPHQFQNVEAPELVLYTLKLELKGAVTLHFQMHYLKYDLVCSVTSDCQNFLQRVIDSSA